MIHPLLLLLRTQYYPEHFVLKSIQYMLYPQPQVYPPKGTKLLFCIVYYLHCDRAYGNNNKV